MEEARISGIEEGIEQLRAQDITKKGEDGQHLKQEEYTGNHCQRIGTGKIVQQILK